MDKFDNTNIKKPALLVLSDSHGSLGNVCSVLEWGKCREFAALVFLGDGAGDIPEAARRTGFSAGLKLIRGNCDQDPCNPYNEVFIFEKKTLLLTHGHLFGVSHGPDMLVTAAKNVGARIVLFGHTHVPFMESIDGVFCVNPGSIGRPRGRAGPSFATIECPRHGEPEISFWEVHKKGRIEALE